MMLDPIHAAASAAVLLAVVATTLGLLVALIAVACDHPGAVAMFGALIAGLASALALADGWNPWHWTPVLLIASGFVAVLAVPTSREMFDKAIVPALFAIAFVWGFDQDERLNFRIKVVALFVAISAAVLSVRVFPDEAIGGKAAPASESPPEARRPRTIPGFRRLAFEISIAWTALLGVGVMLRVFFQGGPLH